MAKIQDKKQKELLELAQAGGTDKDLVILEKIHRIEDEFDSKTQEFVEAVEKLRDDFPDLDKVLESVRGPQGDKGEKGDKGDKGDTGPQGIQGIKGDKGDRGDRGIDGKDGLDGKDGEKGDKGDQGDPGLDGSPDTPKDIKVKLESLKDDERLKASAILGLDGIDKKIPELERIIRNNVALPATTSFFNGYRAKNLNIIGGTAVQKGDTVEVTVSGGGGGAWGEITGTLSDQTDLQSALDGKIEGTISSGQVAFGTDADTLGGDNDLHWDNTNKRLGVGTISPDEKLHITKGNVLVENTGIGSNFFVNRTDGVAFSFLGGANNGVLKYTETGGLYISRSSKADVLSGTGPGTTVMFLTGNGNVGIGTTTPDSPLHVVGSIRGSRDFISTGSDIRLFLNSTNLIFRGIRGTGWTDLTQTDYFQIGLTTSFVAFTAANATVMQRTRFQTDRFQITNQTGQFPTIPVGLFEVRDGSNARFNILQNGNVGINNVSPSEKLDVVGNILASGTITGSLDANNEKVINVALPTNSNDAVNKDYADNLVEGLKWKNSVRVATTGNITLSGEQTIDGVAVVADDRVLVKDQNNETENGIYIASASAWSRSSDADTGTELISSAVNTEAGVANADTMFVCINTVIDIGVSNITFVTLGSTISHNNTTGKQGGTTNEYYHLTESQHSALHSAVTLAGNNYLSISGQEITAEDINLSAHVTSLLPITNGGTGKTSFDSGYLLYGAFNQDTKLFWDDTNDRLGVGTGTPSEIAHIYGAGLVDPLIETSGGASYRASIGFKSPTQEFNFGLNTNDDFRVRDMTAGTNFFTFEKGQSANALYIKANGYIGSGTDSPSGNLHIDGSTFGTNEGRLHLETSGATVNSEWVFTPLWETDATTPHLRLYRAGTGTILDRSFNFGDGTLAIGKRDADGTLDILSQGRTDLILGSKESSTTNIGFANDSILRWGIGSRPGQSHRMYISASPTSLAGGDMETASVLTILQDGKVGFGTNDPTQQIDINGQIRIRGGSPGAGKFLKSDANGVATWDNISASAAGNTGNIQFNGAGALAGDAKLNWNTATDTVEVDGEIEANKFINTGSNLGSGAVPAVVSLSGQLVNLTNTTAKQTIWEESFGSFASGVANANETIEMEVWGQQNGDSTYTLEFAGTTVATINISPFAQNYFMVKFRASQRSQYSSWIITYEWWDSHNGRQEGLQRISFNQSVPWDMGVYKTSSSSAYTVSREFAKTTFLQTA